MGGSILDLAFGLSFCSGLIIGSGLTAYAFMRRENWEKNDQRLVGIYKRLNSGLSINRNCLLAQYNGPKKIIRSHALAQPMS